MHMNDTRSEHLGWVETALRRNHPDLPRLRLLAQSHYGPTEAVAFVEVHGVDEDRDRRRTLRAQAGDLLRRLGYRVEFEPGRDVYDIRPYRPQSAHEELHMLALLQAAMTGKADGQIRYPRRSGHVCEPRRFVESGIGQCYSRSGGEG
jgi:hypothetical protein